MARAWGTSNSPCPLPALPQALMNFPYFENFTMRALVFSPCPSATKMSPLRDQDIGRPIEGVGPVARDPGLAQRHQHLPIGTEFDDCVALAVAAPAVGHPDVAVPVREQAVRPIDHAGAEARHQLARGVELMDRRDI